MIMSVSINLNTSLRSHVNRYMNMSVYEFIDASEWSKNMNMVGSMSKSVSMNVQKLPRPAQIPFQIEKYSILFRKEFESDLKDYPFFLCISKKNPLLFFFFSL